MSTTLIKCHICLDFKGTRDFKFFSCGHGFCTPCIDELVSRSTSKSFVLCPECRTSLRCEDAHPIYCEIATHQVEQAMAIEKLLHGLSRIDEDSKAISVEIAEKKLKKLAKTLDSSETNVTILIEAVMELKERIIPVFRRVEEQSREIERLKRQLSSCQTEVAAGVRRIETLKIERDEAHATLRETIDERDKALDLGNQVARKTVQLREDLARAKAQESGLEDTNNLYKAQLLQHKEMERRQSEKIKSLKQQLAIAQQEAQNEWDARLEVDLDSPASLSQRPRKRRALSPPPRIPVQSSDANAKSTLFEAMPEPGQFGSNSNWNPMRPDLKKQKIANTYPVKLDKRGRPIGAVQIGIRKTIRITR
ncbi:hypothetical protein H2248_009697 [Termitomyces sp. 'cryptogamus']|nr:hypothetical protein H2248_009697 [Termitomyces sp. 'cryptogamus']